MESINDRLRQLIEALELNNNLFAGRIGVNPVVTHNIISGRRTKPSVDVLEKILLSFDNVSAEWLICGRGAMWRNLSKLPAETNLPSKKNDITVSMFDLLREQLRESQHNNHMLLDIIKNLSQKEI